MPLIFGKKPSGEVVPIALDASGNLVVAGMSNILLDGSNHTDTVSGAAAKGYIIVGIDQGGGSIKWQRLAPGSTGQVLTVQSDGSLAWAAAAGGDSGHILIIDQKTQNTPGGTFTSGSWQTRDLNTEVFDTGFHATVSSNQITLQPGTYRCHIICPAAAVNRHKARLYNVTGTTVLLGGMTSYADPTNVVQNNSYILGRFTLSVASVLEVQHRAGSTRATNGFGVESNFAAEIYTMAEFWRE